jgi:hypothetical protein
MLVYARICSYKLVYAGISSLVESHQAIKFVRESMPLRTLLYDMYVCMCVCLCVCVYTYTHTHTHACRAKSKPCWSGVETH